MVWTLSLVQQIDGGTEVARGKEGKLLNEIITSADTYLPLL